MSDPAISRRHLLGMVGLTAVSGCSALPTDVIGNDERQLDGAMIRALTSRPAPAFPDRVPVPIESTHLDRHESRIQGLLASVPTPLGPNDVPNGAIREELTEAHGRVQSRLYDAEQAETSYEAMVALRSARSFAREVAAGWRYITGDLTRDALREEATTVQEATKRFSREWVYLGGDAVQATVVYSRIEQTSDSATSAATITSDQATAEPENPVTIGELGRDIERAQAYLEDAEYLYNQYTDSLDQAKRRESVLRAAAEALKSQLETRQSDLPRFDPDNPSAVFEHDVSETPAALALRDLYPRITSPRLLEDEYVVNNPAHSVLVALEALARLDAFSAIYEAVERGETFTPESASDVAGLRLDAIEALESARDHTHHPRLTYVTLAKLAQRMEYVDDRLTRMRSEESASRIAREIAEYVAIAESAEAVPDLAARAVAALSASQ